MIMLGAAISVSREVRQIRVAHRNPMRIPATLELPDGHAMACETSDYSTGGLGLTLPESMSYAHGTPLGVCLSMGERLCYFEATVVRSAGKYMGVAFGQMSVEKERELIQCTFGRADAWLGAETAGESDLLIHSMLEVVVLGLSGYVKLCGGLARSFWSLLALDKRRAL
jgi:cellulose synthase (UDP-forming)